MRGIPLFGALAALAAVLTSASVASAVPFGQSGDVSFAADRLMGVYIYNEDPEKLTAVGLFAPPVAHPYLIARFAVDFFPIHHLSLGGSFAYTSYDRDRNNGSAFLFSPRVGYAIDFSDAFGFWPRGGITYRDNGGDEELALTFEAMFWAAPVRHFAFTFGPVLDAGIAGSGTEALSFGILTVGIMGWI